MNKQLTTTEPVKVIRTIDLDTFLQRNRKLTGVTGRINSTAHATCEIRALCADGYEISIQCSYNHYCSPRETHVDTSVYKSFELGFPNKSDEILEDYAENEDQTKSIFVYVPRRVVEALVEAHGGILA